jgi:hypothetical protein
MSVGEALLDFWHLEISLMTMHAQREQSKAAQYIQQLDEARCEGNWDAVPELVRKIKKHAPHRTCTSPFIYGTVLLVVSRRN